MGDVTMIGEPGVTRQEISVLCGWPELAGYVILGIPAEATDNVVRLACDTRDLSQIADLLRAVATKLEGVIR
jgi:hypothetical protein